LIRSRPGRDALVAGFASAFLAGRYAPFTRVDLTQHCISAFLIAGRHGLLGDRD
jgi:hypothetical protein